MINLNQLSKDRDKLEEILSNEVVITPKFFGNRFLVKITDAKATYSKVSKKTAISKIDLLLSDLYHKPINHINTNLFLFEDGEYYFTNDYKTNKLILDHSTRRKIPMESDYMVVCKPLFAGKVNKNLREAIESNNNKKVFNALKADESITNLIIKSPSGDFKIENDGFVSETYQPSDIYNLLVVDIIKNIDPEFLKTTIIESKEQDDIYIALINRLFINYLSKTKYELESIDLGYPDYMKVNPESKKDLIPDMMEHFKGNNLYEYYTMFLATFQKSKLRSNVYMNEDIKKKHKEIYTLIKNICKEPLSYTTIPTFKEFCE